MTRRTNIRTSTMPYKAALTVGVLFGARLLPIGTLYDPFVKRGLDALNYALYQDGSP